ncbi:MAG: ABC transporter ATP-binding protein [Promethearchaeota archaeon]
MIKKKSSLFQKKNESPYSLELQNVYVGYGKKNVLHNITLKVKRGSILGVIGGSGAGKSTGIRVMTAQLAPSKGLCKTAGFNVKTHPEDVQMRIGYVPQLEYLSLYYKFNAIDNALFFGRNFGVSDKILKERCKEIMEILGLGDKEYLKKPIRKLSGGEKKRVSIMIGLINRPEILFLDEPTTGLDPHLRIEVLNFLSRINKKYGTTMVIVSHDLECVDYCDTVMVFSDGVIADFGNPREMTHSLPNRGRALTVKFDHLELGDEKRIESINEIIYMLHVGRNTFKLYFNDEKHIDIVLDKLEEMGHIPVKYYVNTCVFLDYFRVHSTYTYPKKTKELKAQIASDQGGPL